MQSNKVKEPASLLPAPANSYHACNWSANKQDLHRAEQLLACLREPPQTPASATCGAAHPGTSSRGMGHIHPQHLPSHSECARASKTPGMPLACCHRPSHSISLYHLLCLEIPFHFPAAYGQQSSCATLSCVTTMQLPNQLRQKGKGGA